MRREALSYEDAISTFDAAGAPRTALLLRYDNRSRIPVDRCGSFVAPSHGPLMPHTGFLREFEVRPYAPGLLLRYPTAGRDGIVPEFRDDPMVFAIYNEHAGWERILSMNCVGRLNETIDSGRIREVIHVAEALQNKKISKIADAICESSGRTRLVVIAGPSSSGKTTFAKKLSIELQAMGKEPTPLSVDDYFLPRERTPLGSEGKPDFEALEAVDVDLLNDHLKRLLAGESVVLPRYDFVTGSRSDTGPELRLSEDSVLVVEGIHALNDRLTPVVPRPGKFKVYVSAITQLALDNYTRIPTTDNRLVRRMVRDHRYRGHSALQTLRMWPSVRRGEERNIFPHQNTADAVFNSALVYELAVLKVYAEPLLRTIKPDAREYSDARRILYLLSHFSSITPTWVPSQSILREFVGGSEFHY